MVGRYCSDTGHWPIGSFVGQERYEGMEDLARLDACCPKGPDYLSAQLGQVVTPLCWQAWDQALRGHPDNQFRRYIVKGIREGFRVGCTRSRTGSSETLVDNMPSAWANPEVIDDYLAKECGMGRVLGPLDPAQYRGVHISRFGVVPKGNSGAWRLVVDMSHL